MTTGIDGDNAANLRCVTEARSANAGPVIDARIQRI
jgi:hypothetical protein